jgi:sugar O-acyltransferase (sialic acid O-acetyltransferase NeuD family)
MKRGVILLGCGGHGSVVLDCLTKLEFETLGVVDRMKPADIGAVPYLGDEDILESYRPEEILLANGVGSVGRTTKRSSLFQRWRQRDFRFATIIHPSAVRAETVSIGEGAQVMAGVVIQPHVRIGNNVIINTSAVVDHHCAIGDHVHVAPGAVLSGTVSVGAGTHIGTGVRVMQNIRIGANCVVGMGVTVLADIPDNTVVSAADHAVWS